MLNMPDLQFQGDEDSSCSLVTPLSDVVGCQRFTRQRLACWMCWKNTWNFATKL